MMMMTMFIFTRECTAR